MAAIAKSAPSTMSVSAASVVDNRFLSAERARMDFRPTLEMATTGDVTMGLLDRSRAADLPIARRWLAAIPAEDHLMTTAALFERAARRPADPAEITVAVAFLVESFPNRGAGAGPGYVAAIEMVLQPDFEHPMSIAAISAGMRELVLTSKFVPTAAEVYSAVDLARRRFAGALHRVNHLIEMRRSAEEVIASFDEDDEDADAYADDEVPF